MTGKNWRRFGLSDFETQMCAQGHGGNSGVLVKSFSRRHVFFIIFQNHKLSNVGLLGTLHPPDLDVDDRGLVTRISCE